MKVNIYQKITTAFLLALCIFWSFLYFAQSKSGFYNYLYSYLFGLIPFVGGIVAMYRSRIWGTFRSALGKAVFFIGLGLFLWGFGESIWSYYNFFKGIAAPYPSLADLGFAPSIFFYGIGVVFLAKATGAKYGLRHKYAKVFIILAPIVILAISYYLLVVVARGGVLVPPGETQLKTILDLAYPFGDVVSLSLGVIISGLSFKYLGGKFTGDIIAILAGVTVMFIADTVFAYTTTVSTYYNADFGDLMLTFGMFLLTFGVLGLCKIPKAATVSN